MAGAAAPEPRRPGPLFGYGDRDRLDATADVSSPVASDRGLHGIHFRPSGRDRFCSRPWHVESARHDVAVSLPRTDAGGAPARTDRQHGIESIRRTSASSSSPVRSCRPFSVKVSISSVTTAALPERIAVKRSPSGTKQRRSSHGLSRGLKCLPASKSGPSYFCASLRIAFLVVSGLRRAKL